MARAQTAKEAAREKRWQERDESAPDTEDEPDDEWYEQTRDAGYDAWDSERSNAGAAQCSILRDIFGLLPFRSVIIDPAWRTPTVLALAQATYDNRLLPVGTLDNARLAVLADALEDVDCTNDNILNHCRRPGEHVRGCWALDLLLGKE
jgi:hypothetical protein